ncbi:MAG: GNAT family N-acetyltransferase [Chloroflexota bacterium]
MSGVTIRPAIAADTETLLALIDGLADYEKLTAPDAEARARFAAEISRDPPRTWCYLAEADGAAVGYAVVCETYSTFSMRPKLFLEDIFVTSGARATGAGHALFRAISEEAIRRDCSAIVWEVLDWNKLAIGFYQRVGGKRFDGWSEWRIDRAAMERLVAS